MDRRGPGTVAYATMMNYCSSVMHAFHDGRTMTIVDSAPATNFDSEQRSGRVNRAERHSHRHMETPKHERDRR